MEDTREYVRRQETRCSRLLDEFNRKTGWFKEMHPNRDGSVMDFTATDVKGRKCHVELKERKGRTDTYEDILLDATKLFGWARIGMSGATLQEQRLYFNFFEDGVVIFDINRQKEMRFYPNHRQWNPALGRYETRDKIGLPVSSAIVYRYDSEGGLERIR